MGTRMNHTPISAFTLLELSLVIAVLGLLAGTLMGGQALIKNQQLKKIGMDATQYRVAFEQFKQQYSYYPGDMPNATAIWGRADGVAGDGQCATPLTDTSSGTGTCNGNGNGVVKGACSASAECNESFRVWEHLENAKLVTGPYEGIGIVSAGSKLIVPGRNVPISSVQNASFTFGFFVEGVANTSHSHVFAGDFNNVLAFGGGMSSGGAGRAALSIENAALVDLKFDDGKPSSGNIVTSKKYASLLISWVTGVDCSNGNAQGAEYNFSDPGIKTEIKCNLFFLAQYANTPPAH